MSDKQNEQAGRKTKGVVNFNKTKTSCDILSNEGMGNPNICRKMIEEEHLITCCGDKIVALASIWMPTGRGLGRKKSLGHPHTLSTCVGDGKKPMVSVWLQKTSSQALTNHSS